MKGEDMSEWGLEGQAERTVATLLQVARALRAPHLGCFKNAEELEAAAKNLRAALDRRKDEQ